MATSFQIVHILLIVLLLQSACGRDIGRNSLDDSNQNIADDKLIFSHTLCRHGDRNIYESYPSDPWKSVEHWPGGFAKLTLIGRQQQYQLGQFFRKRYQSLLGDGGHQISPNTIYVRSTDVDRVLKSARANLAGIASTDAQEWSENLEGIVSIPVNTMPRIDDFVLASDRRCDHFDYVMLKYMNTPEYKNVLKQHRSLIRYLEENTGMKLPTFTALNILYDILYIEQLKGKRIPKWAEEVMMPGGDFEFLMKFYFIIFTQTTEMKRLKSGFLLKEILDRFTNKTQSTLTPDRNLWMYFAHDITLSNMLNSLGLFELHQPQYSSCILFELKAAAADDKHPYVQIFYKNSTAADIPALEISGCGKSCPLEKMYEIYHDILPSESFEKECVLRENESLPADTTNPENNSL